MDKESYWERIVQLDAKVDQNEFAQIKERLANDSNLVYFFKDYNREYENDQSDTKEDIKLMLKPFYTDHRFKFIMPCMVDVEALLNHDDQSEDHSMLPWNDGKYQEQFDEIRRREHAVARKTKLINYCVGFMALGSTLRLWSKGFRRGPLLLYTV